MPDNGLSTVQVVLRVRPSAEKAEAVVGSSLESIKMDQHDSPWEHVFDPAVTQQQFFEDSVSALVKSFVEGVNVSILAYGRPYTGKSYTLGTSEPQEKDQEGLILRTIAAVFQRVSKKQSDNTPGSEFAVNNTMRPTPRRVQSNARLRPSSSIVLPRRESSPNLRVNRATNFTIKISLVDIINETAVDLLEAGRHTDQCMEYEVANLAEAERYLKSGIKRDSSANGSHRLFSLTVEQECWISKLRETSILSRKASTLPISRSVSTKMNVKEIVGQMEKRRLDDSGEGEWVKRRTKLHIVDLSGSSCGSLDVLNLLSKKKTVHNSTSPCTHLSLMRTLQHSHGQTSALIVGCVSASPEDWDSTLKTITELGQIKLNKADAADPTTDHVNLRELVSQARTKVISLKQDHPDNGNHSLSTSSTDPSEPRPMSSETSSSLATSVSLDSYGSEPQQLVLSDLRRQIEELHNQVTVTKERNMHVENELKQLREISIAKIVPNKYEQTISNLESQLSQLQAELIESNKALASQAVVASLRNDQPESDAPVLQRQVDWLNKEKRAAAEIATLKAANMELQTHLEASEAAQKTLELKHIALQNERQLVEDQLKNTELLKECNIKLEEKVQALSESEKKTQDEIESLLNKNESLKKHIQDHEQGTQIALRLRLEELEKLKRDLLALQSVEEKQDAVIGGLENQNKDLEALSQDLHKQLCDRDTAITALEETNKEAKKHAQLMQLEVERVLRDVNGMGAERKQLEKVIEYFEGTLYQQGTKTDKAFQTLQDLRQQYTGREEELEEKRMTVELLQAQKEELAQSLELVRNHSTKHDERMREMEKKLQTAEDAISAQITRNKDLEMSRQLTDIEVQRGRALESRVVELDRVVTRLEKKEQETQRLLSEKKEEVDRLQHKLTRQAGKSTALEKKVIELEETIQAERALVRDQDTTGMISKLEKKIDMLEQTKKASEEDFELSYEKALNELEEANQEVYKQQQFIQALQAKYHHLITGDLLEQFTSLTQTGNRESTLSSISSQPQTPRASTSSPLPTPHLIQPRPSLGDTEATKRTSNSSLISLLGLRSRSSTPTLPPPFDPPASPLPPLPSSLSPAVSTRSLSSTDSLTNLGNTMTADQYQAMITSYQAKLRQSENDARMRQETVSSLEERVAHHEQSSGEINAQLQKSREEVSEWQKKLQQERDLKLKAEKARSILEKRLDDLMSKRNRFVCF